MAMFCVGVTLTLQELGSDFKEDSRGKLQQSAVSVMAVIDIFRLI